MDLLLWIGNRRRRRMATDLIFHAPFNNPSNPLRIKKGTGPFTFNRNTTATYVHPTTGLVTPAAVDELRIESLGALFEGQETNLCLRSEELDAAEWVPTNVDVTPDDAVAPDGETTAELLSASGANGTIIQDVGTASGPTIFSIWLRRKTGTGSIQLTLDGGLNWYAVAVTSSWTRVEKMTFDPDPDVGIRIVTSGDEVWCWGAQSEAERMVPSSYIPTTDAPATRNADDLLLPSSGNIISTVGTVFYQADAKNKYPYGGSMILMVSTVTGDSVGEVAGGYPYVTGKLDANDGTAQRVGPDWTYGATHKAAIAWSDGDSLFRFCVDGGAIVGPAFDGALAISTNMSIGGLAGLAAYALRGHVKDLKIYNVAKSDAELQALST